MRRLWWLLPTGLIALTSAANGQSDHVAKQRVVDCETRSQVIPQRNYHLHTHRNFGIGPVTFTGWFQFEPADDFEPQRGRSVLIKAPIFVKAGDPVTLSLEGKSSSHAEIDIGTDQGRSVHGDSVTLIPCPPDATVAGRRVGKLTPFLGGYRVDGPTCLELHVYVEGESAQAVRDLPVGRGSCR